jgi:flagellar motility protein MotE (MotC chaperone)
MAGALEVDMDALFGSIEALSAELERQEEERAGLARVAAAHEDVRFVIGEACDEEAAEAMARLSASTRNLQPRPTFVGVRA